MTTTGDERVPVVPALQEAVAERTAGLRFEPGAEALIREWLENASTAARPDPPPQVVEWLLDLMLPVVEQIVAQVRAADVTVVDATLLTALAAPFCPMPPFCFGEGPGMAGFGSGTFGSGVAAPQPVGA
jgi:hypothetical protein